MAKKPSKSATKTPNADEHRKRAAEHRARARLHEAKAEMLDVKNPPKKPNQLRGVY